jgi:hypothetical protein
VTKITKKPLKHLPGVFKPIKITMMLYFIRELVVWTQAFLRKQ